MIHYSKYNLSLPFFYVSYCNIDSIQKLSAPLKYFFKSRNFKFKSGMRWSGDDAVIVSYNKRTDETRRELCDPIKWGVIWVGKHGTGLKPGQYVSIRCIS